MVGFFGPTEAVHLRGPLGQFLFHFIRFSCPITDTTKHTYFSCSRSFFFLSFHFPFWMTREARGLCWQLRLRNDRLNSTLPFETTDNSGHV